MMTRTRRCFAFVTVGLASVAGGCASQAPSLVSYNTSEDHAQPTSLAQMTTLGAGDNLGNEIYRQDVYIAYLEQVQGNTATASVIEKSSIEAGE